jgi:hypothetical protein
MEQAADHCNEAFRFVLESDAPERSIHCQCMRLQELNQQPNPILTLPARANPWTAGCLGICCGLAVRASVPLVGYVPSFIRIGPRLPASTSALRPPPLDPSVRFPQSRDFGSNIGAKKTRQHRSPRPSRPAESSPAATAVTNFVHLYRAASRAIGSPAQVVSAKQICKLRLWMYIRAVASRLFLDHNNEKSLAAMRIFTRMSRHYCEAST